MVQHLLISGKLPRPDLRPAPAFDICLSHFPGREMATNAVRVQACEWWIARNTGKTPK